MESGHFRERIMKWVAGRPGNRRGFLKGFGEVLFASVAMLTISGRPRLAWASSCPNECHLDACGDNCVE